MRECAYLLSMVYQQNATSNQSSDGQDELLSEFLAHIFIQINQDI